MLVYTNVFIIIIIISIIIISIIIISRSSSSHAATVGAVHTSTPARSPA